MSQVCPRRWPESKTASVRRILRSLPREAVKVCQARHRRFVGILVANVIFLYSPTRTRRLTPSVAVGDSEGT